MSHVLWPMLWGDRVRLRFGWMMDRYRYIVSLNELIGRMPIYERWLNNSKTNISGRNIYKTEILFYAKMTFWHANDEKNHTHIHTLTRIASFSGNFLITRKYVESVIYCYVFLKCISINRGWKKNRAHMLATFFFEI